MKKYSVLVLIAGIAISFWLLLQPAARVNDGYEDFIYEDLPVMDRVDQASAHQYQLALLAKDVERIGPVMGGDPVAMEQFRVLQAQALELDHQIKNELANIRSLMANRLMALKGPKVSKSTPLERKYKVAFDTFESYYGFYNAYSADLQLVMDAYDKGRFDLVPDQLSKLQATQRSMIQQMIYVHKRFDLYNQQMAKRGQSQVYYSLQLPIAVMVFAFFISAYLKRMAGQLRRRAPRPRYFT